MTRRPASTRSHHAEEAHAAPSESTAPEPAVEEAERRAALGRVFGTEA